MATPETERVVALLRERTEEAGSVRAFADQHDTCHTYVSDVLKGAKLPGPRILVALGLMKVISYVEIDGGRP
ncbi:hypothetical protein MKK55_07780 [Methylobacterium sp. J-059]|uniref:hypothetical protein n=1 Tax=Methylobacterium sp. J-059 TaxID=2836643 RepID=UPI001FBA36B8|nr:hypothetical protein [Methylobacterium sp. J-059]MCJ2038853.1 hypothetical protein [Methylobacterium sp. J-059]